MQLFDNFLLVNHFCIEKSVTLGLFVPKSIFRKYCNILGSKILAPLVKFRKPRKSETSAPPNIRL